MSSSAVTVRAFVASLEQEAIIRSGVPESVARRAAESTVRALGAKREAGHRERRRCSSYFWAVVRRRLVRVGGSSTATARFVLSTVVEDMRAAGRDSGSVWLEIQRGWGDRVPAEVLEEYRVRLCA